MSAIQELTGTITPSSGSGSVSLVIAHAVLGEIVITSANSSTTFDVTITNAKGVVVYDDQSNIGTLRETVTIPMRGVATLAIYNSSADEAFTYYVSLIESYA